MKSFTFYINIDQDADNNGLIDHTPKTLPDVEMLWGLPVKHQRTRVSSEDTFTQFTLPKHSKNVKISKCLVQLERVDA